MQGWYSRKTQPEQMPVEDTAVDDKPQKLNLLAGWLVDILPTKQQQIKNYIQGAVKVH